MRSHGHHICEMASLDSSSGPTISLLALPGEIQNAILARLDFLDLYTLRLTNRYFHSLIPPMTSEIVFEIEEEFMPDWYLACAECKRLRPVTKFIPGTLRLFKKSIEPTACMQRCEECVRQYLNELDPYWMRYNVPIVWCVKCKRAIQARIDIQVQHTLVCHPQDSKSNISS